MNNLSQMPNINKEREKQLEQTGVNTPDALCNLGFRKAYLRIQLFDSGAGLSMLCALEGAIQRISWHNLSREAKSAHLEFTKLKKV
jgi:DNA transformation protein and related proteins